MINSKALLFGVALTTVANVGQVQAQSQVTIEKRYETEVKFNEPLPLEYTTHMDFRKGYVDFGVKFESLTRLCFIPLGNSKMTYSRIGAGHSLNLSMNNREPYCRSKGSLSPVFDLYMDGQEAIEVSVGGEGVLTGYKVVAYTTGAISDPNAEQIYVDAVINSLGSAGGHALSYQVEPNVTYELIIGDGLAIFDTTKDAEMANVAVSYVNAENHKLTIATIDSAQKAYLTTDGTMNFFFVDDGLLNKGGVTVNLKRVNLN
ncbi:hypothetical protein [Photobacterium kasasachensis]|uniref:hypothetical protein n=1 Tax=Photobacterium kasasachensis TaxID=2910240 RepID=UPI003D13EA3B